MPPLLIAYPAIDPVLVAIGPFLIRWPIVAQIGPFPIRWYALAYIGGLIGGWMSARYLVNRQGLWAERAHASAHDIDDLVIYIAAGIILGGRLGYVLFYNLPFYLANPLEIVMVGQGGMAFHGGLIGAAIAIALFARKHGLPVSSVADVVAPVVPIGLCLGRIANFIKPELWGRPTDVPWAMIFPGSDGQPRHPSQLYEAGLEGLALFVVLWLVIGAGGLKRPWLITGLFCVLYGIARIACEFFRQPDPQLGFLFANATMGMLLSVPLILAGLGLLAIANRSRPAATVAA